jgi:hypothetical protein
MGIGFVLLIWAVVGVGVAGIGALVLGGTAAYFTRGVEHGRKQLILVASLFPLICLAWAGVVFAFQAAINEMVFHRDAGLGDTWNCPLPNGYALLMIDTTDQGFVYNPKTQPENAVAEQEDAVAGVRVLQVAGRYILGGSDSRSFQRSENQSEQIDSYFLLDTQIGKQTRLPSYEALRAKVRELGITANLERISSVYYRYRFTWFEVFAGLLLLLPPLVSALVLLRWTLRLRKHGSRLCRVTGEVKC